MLSQSSQISAGAFKAKLFIAFALTLTLTTLAWLLTYRAIHYLPEVFQDVLAVKVAPILIAIIPLVIFGKASFYYYVCWQEAKKIQ